MYEQADRIREILESANRILILQADNPDGDSLGSALALESILGELGKEPLMYCAVDVPTYLRYLAGWDRVETDMPAQFDASIIVDASTMTLFEKLSQSGHQGWVAAKPCIVLDHHAVVENPIPFATISIVDEHRSSTGELIFALAQQLNWPMPDEALACIATAILGDTQGLSNSLTGAETYRVMAELTEAGLDRPALEELRRESNKMPAEIFRYKAQLIGRTELSADGRVASVMVPQPEINEFSPLYNPAPLIQGDMLMTRGVQLAIVFKRYADGKVTAAIRSNPGAPVAAELASRFGGGGHAFASGFKRTDAGSFDELKTKCLSTAEELLNDLEREQNEAV